MTYDISMMPGFAHSVYSLNISYYCRAITFKIGRSKCYCVCCWFKKASLKKNSCYFLYYAWLKSSDGPFKYQDLLKFCILKLKYALDGHLLEVVISLLLRSLLLHSSDSSGAHTERNPPGVEALWSALLWVARGFNCC